MYKKTRESNENQTLTGKQNATDSDQTTERIAPTPRYRRLISLAEKAPFEVRLGIMRSHKK